MGLFCALKEEFHDNATIVVHELVRFFIALYLFLIFAPSEGDEAASPDEVRKIASLAARTVDPQKFNSFDMEKNELKISELLKSGANIQLVINALDLKEAFLAWQEELGTSQPKQDETYLTTKEAAEKCGVDVSTLWRWDKIGYLKKVKLGSKPYWRLSDIEKLMEG